MRGSLAQSRMAWVAAAYLGGMAAARQLSTYVSTYSLSATGAGMMVAFLAIIVALWQMMRSRNVAGWCVLACCALAGFGVYLAAARMPVALPSATVPGPFSQALSGWMKSGIDASTLPEHAAYIKSILLGDRGGMPLLLAEDYSRSGLVHILSVSGLHVAFVSYAVGLVSGMVLKKGSGTTFIQLAAVGAYALACGAGAPVVRSAVMLSATLLGSLAGRRSNSLSSLAVAAILSATVQPASIASASFQLSYCAVVSLSVLGPVLRQNLAVDARCEGRPVARYLADSVVVSLSATLGTLPLLAFHFGQVSIVSIIANIVAVPVSGAIVVLGLLQAIVTHAFVPLGQALGATNGVLIDTLNSFVHVAGNLPYASVTIGAPKAWGVVLAYLFILWACSELTPGYFGPSASGRGRVALAISLVLVVSALGSMAGLAKSHPRVTFINVGQGDSILVESRDGRRVLVDCGPGSFKPGAPDAGTRYVLPYLRKRGLSSLDAVILTHNDLDHIGGAETVLRGVRVRALFRSPGGSETASSEGVWALARKMALPLRALSRGDIIRLGSDVSLKVISPSREQYEDPEVSDNDRSIVIDVISPKRTVLLTGDLEADGEHALVNAEHDGLDVDVLKVGHHGSHSSTTEEFLSAVSPELSVISVGTNRYGHPHRDTIARLSSHGTRILRTDRDGNISVDLTAGIGWVHTDGKGRYLDGFGREQKASQFN